MRRIIGLNHVRFLADRPHFIPKARVRGAQARGLTYERKFGRELARSGVPTYSGRWIEYEDLVGRGWAQPDHFQIHPEAVVVFECKLTETVAAWEQLRQYVLLLGHAFKRPAYGVQVCRNLTTTKRPCRDVSLLGVPPSKSVLHWLGS